MTPNFNSVESMFVPGGQCFRPSVRSIIVHSIVSKFNIWVPHENLADSYLFLVRVISLCGIMTLKTSGWICKQFI